MASLEHRRLKVAYLVNLYPAVSHTFIRREILALEQHGIEVMRLALRPGAVVDELDRQEQARTHYVLALGMPRLMWALLRTTVISPRAMFRAAAAALAMARGSDRPWPIHLAYLAEACVIVDWMRRAGIHHLHAHFATNPAEIALLARTLGGPRYSFTAHGSDIMDRPAQVGLSRTVAGAAFVVAVCAFGRSQICKWVPHGLWSKVKVVHCGLDASYGGAVTSVSGVDAGATLVCVGRLSSEKGQLVLVEAARLLRDRGRTFEFVLVGDGPMRTTIEARIAEWHLSGHIRLVGAQDAAGVRAAILASRALVVPSLSEGLPVVIMESMALGRPVVAPYLAGIPELVREPATGWLYPAGDAVELANAVIRCLDASVPTLDAMGREGRSKIAKDHDVAVEANKLIGYFSRSDDRPRGPALPGLDQAVSPPAK